jgi:hypothetical protein
MKLELRLSLALCSSFSPSPCRFAISFFLLVFIFVSFVSFVFFVLGKSLRSCSITFFKGGPADPSLQEKEHPTASKIHATLDSCPF